MAPKNARSTSDVRWDRERELEQAAGRALAERPHGVIWHKYRAKWEVKINRSGSRDAPVPRGGYLTQYFLKATEAWEAYDTGSAAPPAAAAPARDPRQPATVPKPANDRIASAPSAPGQRSRRAGAASATSDSPAAVASAPRPKSRSGARKRPIDAPAAAARSLPPPRATPAEAKAAHGARAGSARSEALRDASPFLKLQNFVRNAVQRHQAAAARAAPAAPVARATATAPVAPVATAPVAPAALGARPEALRLLPAPPLGAVPLPRPTMVRAIAAAASARARARTLALAHSPAAAPTAAAPSTFVVVADKLWDDAVHALRCAPPGARPAILPSRRPRGVAWHKARSKWEVRAPMDGGFGVASVVSVADVCAVLRERLGDADYDAEYGDESRAEDVAIAARQQPGASAASAAAAQRRAGNEPPPEHMANRATTDAPHAFAAFAARPALDIPSPLTVEAAVVVPREATAAPAASARTTATPARRPAAAPVASSPPAKQPKLSGPEASDAAWREQVAPLAAAPQPFYVRLERPAFTNWRPDRGRWEYRGRAASKTFSTAAEVCTYLGAPRSHSKEPAEALASARPTAPDAAPAATAGTGLGRRVPTGRSSARRPLRRSDRRRRAR